jgi:hypothetical protein
LCFRRAGPPSDPNIKYLLSGSSTKYAMFSQQRPILVR